MEAQTVVMTFMTFTIEGGSIYEGEVAASNHYPHGKGKMTELDGTSHHGEWKNGKRDGEGITIYSNGNQYVEERLKTICRTVVSKLKSIASCVSYC